MKNFNDRSSGGRNFNKSGGDRDRRFDSKREGRPEMFKAICADCGKPCEIPFKPNNSRPVFCSTCFSEHSGDGFDRSDAPRKEMFEATCDKCGKRCEVPFKPVSGKPVFCSQCFDRDNNGRDGRDSRNGGPRGNNMRSGDRNHENHNSEAAKVEHYKEQFEKLNAKLDLLLASLKPKAEKAFVEIKKEEDKIKTVIKQAKAIEKKVIEPKIKEIKKAVIKKLNQKKKK
ncbi:MAG: CxxC-x17-CxxC domain-containing protein [Patescibacteria group bacterium]